MICNNFETVRDKMSVLFTHRKSHTGFRLILTSMTLNDRERHNSPYGLIYCPQNTVSQSLSSTFVQTPGDG